MSIAPEHKRAGDRLDLDRHRLAAKRAEPRSEAAPTDPCLRVAGRQPCRVQDALAQRPVEDGPARHRRHVRRCSPESLDHGRRIHPRLRVVQRDPPGVAGRQAPHRGTPRPMSDAADLLIVNGRVFHAFGPRDIVPYGSDIGPRPVAGDNSIAIKDGRIAWIGRQDEGLREWQGPGTEVVDAGTAGSSPPASMTPTSTSSAGPRNWPTWTSSSSTRSTRSRRRSPRTPPRTRTMPGSRAAAGCTSRSPAACPRASSWTRSCRTGRRSCAATTATPAGSTARRCALAGIDRDTPDPRDGVIVRDPRTGEATGALKEGAQELVQRHIPSLSEDETLDAMRRSIAAMHAAGITAIQDAWTDLAELPLWRSLLASGDLNAADAAGAPDAPGPVTRRVVADARRRTTRRSPTCAAGRGWTSGS